MDLMSGYQKTAALKAAIELELFTCLGQTGATAAELAARTGASEKGMRVLADYLTVEGLLEKVDTVYRNTPTAAVFLDKTSPAYIGGMTGFIVGGGLKAQFEALTEAVKKGGVAASAEGSTAQSYDGWVDFAKTMEAMMGAAAAQMAGILTEGRSGPLAVLDVAASHGLFGFSIARQHPEAHITALDWANVLEITKANAGRWSLADRVSYIAGDAFTVDLEGPYDIILLTNLLHHFDETACTKLAARLKGALRPGGVVATLEFVPNEDRVSPPGPAQFSLVMLASTPHGDAYTFSQYEAMFRAAGFASTELIPLENTPEVLLLSR
jgi:ubiquinone/menaquinone biosynthesis C-methylase UbiE